MDSNWAGKNYYDILGASAHDSMTVLKKKYRDLARKHHPDTSSGESGNDIVFKKISEAYSVLSDPVKRSEYDEFLLNENRISNAEKNGYAPNDSFRDYYYNDRDDIFNLFENMFSSRSSGPPPSGLDIESEISIDLIDALNGTVLDLNLTVFAPCGCDLPQGSYTTCPRCSGLGSVKSLRKIKTRIPAGVDDKTVLRIPNKGVSSGRGGAKGDLFLKINVRPHPFFKREGRNLCVTVPITYTEAVLGGDITIPLVTNDSVTFKIPALVDTKMLFKINGKGVREENGKQGDLIVKLEVSVPKNITSSERKLLEKYDKLTKFNPRDDIFKDGV